MILTWPLVTGAILLQLVSTSSADVTVSTFAGTGLMGFFDRSRSSMTFDSPHGIVIDGASNVLVSESRSGDIRKITPDRTASTLYVNFRINRPISISSIAINAQGHIFTTDWSSNAVYKITPDGNASVFAGGYEPGYVDGPADVARFNDPRGLAFDSDGNIIVADSMNRCIRKITPNGTVSTLAGSGFRGNHDGLGALAQLNYPYAVAVDQIGSVYVADRGNDSIRKITPNGTVSTLAGNGMSGDRDASGEQVEFRGASCIAVGANGNVFVTDWIDDSIRKITPDGFVSTIAGGSNSGFRDGPGRTARFRFPAGIAIDADGNLMVADSGNNRIRKITFTLGDDVDNEVLQSYGSIQPKPIRYNKDECAICYEIKAEDDEYDYCSMVAAIRSTNDALPGA